MFTPSPGVGGCLVLGGCTSSPLRLTLRSSGFPSTGLQEMGNDQTPDWFVKSALAFLRDRQVWSRGRLLRDITWCFPEIVLLFLQPLSASLMVVKWLLHEFLL